MGVFLISNKVKNSRAQSEYFYFEIPYLCLFPTKETPRSLRIYLLMHYRILGKNKSLVTQIYYLNNKQEIAVFYISVGKKSGNIKIQRFICQSLYSNFDALNEGQIPLSLALRKRLALPADRAGVQQHFCLILCSRTALGSNPSTTSISVTFYPKRHSSVQPGAHCFFHTIYSIKATETNCTKVMKHRELVSNSGNF